MRATTKEINLEISVNYEGVRHGLIEAAEDMEKCAQALREAAENLKKEKT